MGSRFFLFALGSNLEHFTLGVIGMKKNAKRILVIPASLAYGATGVAGRVPANTFELTAYIFPRLIILDR